MEGRKYASDCTDGELRRAVATQHSWRGVLRSLGYKPHSSSIDRTLKRRAAELRLDTSHFTGQRRWTDQQLMQAVAQAESWPDVIHRLGLSDSGDARVYVKGHARRLQLDTTHIDKPDLRVITLEEHLQKPWDRATLRVAAEAIVTAWFTLHDTPVAVPVVPREYDLLISMPEGVRRVQVKSTTCRTKSGKWQVAVGRQSGPTQATLNGYTEYRVGDASSLMGPMPTVEPPLTAVS